MTTEPKRIRLSRANTARWHLECTALRASVQYQATTVARRYGHAVVVLDGETGAELYRAEPLTPPVA